MGVYLEQSVINKGAEKRGWLTWVTRITVILCALFIFLFALLVFVNPWPEAVFFLIMCLPPIGVIILTVRYKNNVNMEYDYFLIDNLLRVVKVVNRRKRKKFLEIKLESITAFGKISDEKHAASERAPGVKIKSAAPNPDDGNIYFAAYKSDRPYLLYFEPDEAFLAALKKALPRWILTK